jgi:hypothetical protein
MKQGFSYYFCLMIEGSDSDPGGPETYGSDGSGSAKLNLIMSKRLQRFSARDSPVMHYRSNEPDPRSGGRLDPGEAGGGGRGANQAQQPEEGPFEQVGTFAGDLIFTQQSLVRIGAVCY